MSEIENVTSLRRYLSGCISAMWSNPDYYLSFLRTSAQMYKYEFQDQVLIHDSRPNALACAESGTWCNDDIRRTLNEGAFAIPLLTTSNGKIGIRYVYDYADTSAIDSRSKSPYFWAITENNEQAIMNALDIHESDIADVLMIKAHEIVSEQSEMYYEDLSDNIFDTLLEELDELNIKSRFENLLEKSVAYSLMSRCGIDMSLYFDKDDFNGLYEFDGIGAMTVLGTAVSDMSEQILRAIEVTIKRERSKENGISKDNIRENSLRTENNVQSGRADADISSAVGDNSAAEGRKIWDNANGLSQKTPQGELQSDAAERNTERAFVGNRQNGEPPIGADDPANDGSAGRDGTTQGTRPNAMGRADEQRETSSGGDNPKRADIQLNNGEAELNGSAFSVPIDVILKHDDFFKIKRGEIAEYFLSEIDGKKRAEFIKSVFNDDFTEFDVSEVRCGYKAWDDGLEIWTGNYLTKSADTRLSWESAARRVGELIERHEYLLDDKTFDIEPEVEEQGGYDSSQITLFDSDVPDTHESAAESKPVTAYRVGDFYEFYGKDAETVAKILELHLSSRNGEPMVGIPQHALEQYTALLEESGFKLTIQEYAAKAVPTEAPLFFANEKLISDVIDRLKTAEIDKENVYGEIDNVLAEMLFGDELSNDEEIFVTDLLNDEDEKIKTFEPRLSELTFKDAVRYLDTVNDVGYYYIDNTKGLSHSVLADIKERAERYVIAAPKCTLNYDFMTEHKISFLKTPRDVDLSDVLGDTAQMVAVMDKALETSGYGYLRPKPMKELRPNDIIRLPAEQMLDRNLNPVTLSESYAVVTSISTKSDGGGDEISLDTYSDKELTDALGKAGYLGDWAEKLETLGAEYLGTVDEIIAKNAVQENTAEISEISVPTITCEWSENPAFEDGKTYSVREFDEIMRKADTEHVAGEKAALEKYGTHENWYNANDEEFSRFYGYDKVKFTVNMPDGTTYTERQDIGDGYGGVIEFLSQYQEYADIIPILREAAAAEATTLRADSAENNSLLANFDKPSNFTITDEHLGEGGMKAKFRANINAIKLLNTLESENRAATPEEQETLSRYVGWGGLPQAFDENNSAWSDEYMELLTLLSPGEYESAKGSTLNAHYTTPTVIRAIYDGLSNLGFENGRVLEPAMGVGNFLGMMPENMRQSSIYGVELDGITGRIARQLYPNAEIQICGYENTNFPDNFFDVAVGNVPFGQYKLSEKRYDKLNLNIHDHFFAKSLDKIRPSGVIAFVTSKGTLDKENSKFRAYLAQRAELLGAIRLPNNAFKDNAGTEVTSDIIFLQKRAEMLENDAPLPDWVQLGKTADGIPVNKYFEQHPEMLLGTMSEDGKMYGGYNTTCVPFEGADLKEQLAEAIKNIRGEIPDYIHEESAEKAADSISTNPARVASPTLVADPNTRNFSFTIVNENIYYRENGEMFRQDLPKATADRVKGMIEIRDCVRRLIDMQLEEYSDDDIKAQQTELNRIYDRFTAKFGLLNDTANSRAFADDSSAPLLNSLEILTEDGKLQRKTDMFTKRTIKPQTSITHADTAMDALAVSLSEKARVDMPFMEQLTGKTESELVNDLTVVIYRVPISDKSEKNYVTADEYLSGNIREKLQTARLAAELEPDIYGANVAALEIAMPKPLDASEIDVRLGATWIDTDMVKQFIVETIQPALYLQDMIKVNFSSYTSEWNVEGKSADRNNVMSTMTYGTERKNAYSIIEDTLNLRDARVYDRVEDANGKTKSVLNKKETTLAQEKQEAIKQAFKDWIFRDPERRERLVNKYNELFNSTRPREYDGSHLNFVGMSPEIQLRPHQLNAIAHTIYGGNTLLAHQVGAGKTFEMVASAMESKRLGLCHKSLFAVPNHLTEQMGAEFMRLYPSANILVATAADFEKKNRKRLISKIATGNYDAIIIGHSQLKKIPLSQERQESMLRHQIKEITTGIRQLAEQKGQHFSVKQLEKTKKSLEARLKKLLDTPKDDVVTFEELGIDKMYIDEAHEFKNLFLYTKIRNVAGIQQTEAEKSSDLYMKCQYMDELTGGKGTVFATGTPISNSMSELYTMMRYLQAHKLKEMGMHNFDAWAANFGEAVTAIELAPEGTGYRAKTRFSKFFNLPELMNVFKESADIKTADDLNLDVPNAHFHNVVVKPSELQKEMVQLLSERAAAVHNKQVAPEDDNMLKITNDGRKIGLDQRLINPDLPDDPNSKVNACVNNVFDIYTKTAEQKSAQLVFCDFSTPKGDGTFNLYDDIRSKLIAMGVPKEEIAFIHDADTEVKKRDLFAKVRSGKVRVMLGSTAKCGAGMNVQDKLVALHHLDCPWRPSDLEQREGRIIRQGNENSDVDVFRYVTEGTFDAYLYQMIENKQRFISQIMTSKSPVRSCEDVDEATLSYAEVKALCAGNPLIKEKMDLDVSVAKLKVLKSNFTSQQYRLEDKVLKEFPQKIQTVEGRIKALEKDLTHFQTITDPQEGISPMTVSGTVYTDKEQAGKALLLALKEVKSARESRHIGSYKGFELSASYDLFGNKYTLDIKRETIYKLELGNSDSGNITRIDNALQSLDKLLEGNKQQLDALHQQLDTAKSEMDKPFPREQELAEKLARLNELNAQLNMDERGAEQDSSVDEDKPAPKKKLTLDERINNVRKQRSAEGQSNDSPGKNRDKTI